MDLIPFKNSYVLLSEKFYSRQEAARIDNPKTLAYNDELGEELGLSSALRQEEINARVFTGNLELKNAQPLAQVYAGHQFGSFVPQLGDGRALLLGEVEGKNGQIYGLQLKGSGRTVFSRQGDGKLALGPAIREYIVSEAMRHLDVPTTRSLALVLTNTPVQRETTLPGAVLTRIARSFVRIGTFQYFAYRRDTSALKELTDHCIKTFCPDQWQSEESYLEFFREVIARQADLVAQWLNLGFIHGVMNTDNMAISGETIDYGPCAFIDTFKFDKVFSSIDYHGRYAYSNQANVALWNLERFAECLIPLIHSDAEVSRERLIEVLKEFPERFERSYLRGQLRKLGIFELGEAQDGELVRDFLTILETTQADFTLSFRRLRQQLKSVGEEQTHDYPLFETPEFLRWRPKWIQRLSLQNKSVIESTELMERHNPAYIPRNHLVEQVIRNAVENENFSSMSRLMEVLRQPYDEKEEWAEYMRAPKPIEEVTATFCGT